MDEAGGCIGILIGIAIAVYVVVAAIGYAIAFLAYALLMLFGHPIGFAIGLMAIGAIAAAIWYSRDSSGSSASEVAVARFGPFESTPRKWFFISTSVLIGALIAYRMVAF